MINTLDKTILFSGRFDKPELGHMMTIANLALNYKRVIVCVLDFEKSSKPLCYRMKVLEDACKHIGNNIEIVSNKIHFGEITKEDLDKFDFDVYGSGNNLVLKHIESLGIKCVYVPRYLDYAATPARQYEQMKRVFNEHED